MKFTLSWLKSHLETDADLKTICDTLTAIGLEIEGLTDSGKSLAPFIIAHVVEATQHPNADRLRVARVDTGAGILQIVCGAPNCRAGLKTVLARPGDVIPMSGEALKLGKIRDVESQGMLCSGKELGLSEDSDGILELSPDAPTGKSYADYAGLNDPVIEINLLPNRPDCTGVRGIARDLAAAGLGTLKPMPIPEIKSGEDNPIKVTLDFPADQKKSCPLFVSTIIRNINNGQSPDWMQARLRAIGLRPISALVDITNYMTFDLARPMHVFDAKKIKGNLHIRPARDGEKLLALNNKEYNLHAGMTVICDDTGVLSLAGIMGGMASSVDENTTDVVLEAAWFDSVRTAKTGRTLQIPSDARYRFERGVDPTTTEDHVKIATKMVLDFCATPQTSASKIDTVRSMDFPTRTMTLSPQACHKRTGANVDGAEQIKILNALGFATTKSGATFSVTIPSWRPDIEGADDLVEEIIRIHGFGEIPSLSLPASGGMTKAIDILDRRSHLARRAMAGLGLMESVTWSFMSEKIAVDFGFANPNLRLHNPISRDLDVMRPSLLPNLIMAGKRNADHGHADLGIFEVGAIWRDVGDAGQIQMGAILRAGHTMRSWGSAARAVDVFDAKGDALHILGAINSPAPQISRGDTPSYYHPGRSGTLRIGSTILGYFGEIHPAIILQQDISSPMVACELFLENIPTPKKSSTAKSLLEIPPLQSISRDFAFVIERKIAADDLIRAIRKADKKYIRAITIFDVYEGSKIDAGYKSIALSVTLQPEGKAFTDAEIEAIATSIAAEANKIGAKLRV